MNHFLRRLRINSYDRSFLWKGSLGIVALGAAIGWIASMMLGVTGPWQLESGGEIDSAIDFVEREEGDFGDFLEKVVAYSEFFRFADKDSLQSSIGEKFGLEEAELLMLFLGALNDLRGEDFERLKAKADASPNVRYANRLIGEIYLWTRKGSLAYESFLKEGTFEGASYSRQKVVDMLIDADSIDALVDLLRNDPLYAEFDGLRMSLLVAQHERDWGTVARLIPFWMMESWTVGYALLTLLAASIWAAVLARLGQMEWGLNRLTLLCVLGFIAGIASIWPTLLWVYLESEYLGFEPSGELVSTIAFYVGGVGLREEVCKLLLFLPLVPFVLKRRNEIDALLVASFVGLGFAAEENINYFFGYSGSVASTRLLTANFLHVSLTGIAGVALVRVFNGGSINEFLFRFGMVVVGHGMYNALWDIPSLGGSGYLALLAFILISMYYFREYDAHRYAERGGMSLTSILAFGLSSVVALSLVFVSLDVGFSYAAIAVFGDALSVIIIVIMFTREFNESLR